MMIPPRKRPRRPLRPLSLWLRITLSTVGWVLVLVGVAGLVLPGIQGILTMLLGAAVLSLGSETIYRWLRAGLARWPKLWRRMEGFRLRLHRRLSRLRRHRRPPTEGNSGGG